MMQPESPTESGANASASKLGILPIITSMADNDKARQYSATAAIVILDAS
jgi:hypothetical protein